MKNLDAVRSGGGQARHARPKAQAAPPPPVGGLDRSELSAGAAGGEMPTESTLQEAFRKALREGGISRGNPEPCENITKFRELFDSGAALPGDIILVGNNAKPELSLLDAAVPGNYSHVGIYLGKNEKGEHQTIDAWVPGATIRSVDWWPQSYHKWCVVRPRMPDGAPIGEEARKKVVEFARSAEGCAYNMKWAANTVVLPVDPEKTQFYCSQLAWAAYNYGAGVDIDANPGFSFRYANGVAPQELRDSKNVSVVAEGDFTPGADHLETRYRFAGGVAGIAAGSALSMCLTGAEVGLAAVCGTVCACALGACLGVWAGKIVYQALM